MEGSSRGGSSSALPSMLLLLTLAVWGIVSSAQKLQSPRPSAQGMLWNEPSVAGKAPSRLWQDPLQAAQKHLEQIRKASKDQNSTSTNDKPVVFKSEADLKKQVESKLRLLVMPVLISGDSWPESEDGRIADRYALLSALGESGFAPVDRDSISYIQSQALDQSGEAIVPYEWLAYEASTRKNPATSWTPPYDDVLVLWVRMDKLPKDQRLGKLGELLLRLGAMATDDVTLLMGEMSPWNVWRKEPRPIETAVFVRSSNLLVDLLEEDVKLSAAGTSPNLAHVTFYAWSASISNKELEQTLRDRLPPAWNLSSGKAVNARSAENKNDAVEEPYTRIIQRTFSRQPRIGEVPASFQLLCGATIIRTIATDDILARLLVKELALRGADPLNKRNHIALVHEWDTVYGRSLPVTFRHACDDADGTHRRPDHDWDTNVHAYTFLRGVDGKLPGVQDADAVASRADSKSSQNAPRPGEAELPVGRGQLDYVRRLVEQLRVDDSRWKSEGHGRLKAIGVFASDVFDKLPVLQALREAFPDVLFFTNDMQAYLVHPSEYKTLRNLLIASPFDLQMGGELQASTPPFRTSYQTALYFASILALRNPAAREAFFDSSTRAMQDIAEGKPTLATARVYEFGRHGAYDLSQDDANLLYPASPRSFKWLCRSSVWNGVFLLATAFLATALLAFGWHTFNGGPGRKNELRRLVDRGLSAFAMFVIVPLVVLAMFMVISRLAPDDEPFEFLEGISIWPSELIRFVVFLLCGWFMWQLWQQSQANTKEIAQRFGLKSMPREHEPPRGAMSSARGVLGMGGSGIAQAGRLAESLITESPDSSWERFKKWNRSRWILGWQPAFDNPDDPTIVRSGTIWKEYIVRGEFRHRAGRSVILFVMFALLAVAFTLLVDWPQPPYRGPWSKWIHFGLMVASFAGINALALVVWDGTRLCDRFVHNLAVKPSIWPDTALAKAREMRGLEGIVANSWLDVSIIATRTESVSKSIYHPFIALLILLLAWSGKIDNWTWTLPLVVAYGSSILVALVAAQSLRRSAEFARGQELMSLRVELMRLNGQAPHQAQRGPTLDGFTGGGNTDAASRNAGPSPAQPVTPPSRTGVTEDQASLVDTQTTHAAIAPQAGTASESKPSVMLEHKPQLAQATPRPTTSAKQIEDTIKEIESIRTGAFAPFTENPALRAALIPFGGIGAVQLLDFLMRVMQ